MLSPTSLAGLSIGQADWTRQIRSISPTQAPSQGSSRLGAPGSPVPLVLPGSGGSSDGGPPSSSLPRGSLLDLSV